MHSEYFQGILQLRPGSKELDKLITEQLGTQVSKKKKVRGGIDYYVKSNKKLAAYGKRIQTEVGGTLTVSQSLHTRDRQSSKDLYRLTILFRPHPFLVGDVVSSDGELYLITGGGKHQTGEHLVSGKRKKMPDDSVKQETQQCVVSKTRPQLEVIDPETYESTAVENSSRYKGKKKARCVKYRRKLFLV